LKRCEKERTAEEKEDKDTDIIAFIDVLIYFLTINIVFGKMTKNIALF
jgi:biopolymer transport protein ExbD